MHMSHVILNECVGVRGCVCVCGCAWVCVCVGVCGCAWVDEMCNVSVRQCSLM